MSVPAILLWVFTGRKREEEAQDEEKGQSEADSHAIVDEQHLQAILDDEDGHDLDDNEEGHDVDGDFFDDVNDAQDVGEASILAQGRETMQPAPNKLKSSNWRKRLWKAISPDDNELATYSPTYRYTPIISGE